MKTVKLLVFLIFGIFTYSSYTMEGLPESKETPESPAPQDDTRCILQISQLLLENIRLNTKHMQLFKADIEEKLKLLEELQKNDPKLEPAILCKKAGTIPAADLEAYWKTIQETKKVITQLSEQLTPHITTVRKLEQAKRN